MVNSGERFGQVSTLQAHWRTNGLDGEAMTDLRDKLARPLIPILREASDLSVGEATVAASTLVNAQMPVVEEAIRQAGLKVLLESSTRLDLGSAGGGRLASVNRQLFLVISAWRSNEEPLWLSRGQQRRNDFRV